MPFPLGLGTFGAIIRIKDRIFSRREFFDIGLAGPLAGFMVAVPLLVYGFTHLPPLDYLFAIHPDYARYGADYAQYVYSPQMLDQTIFWPGRCCTSCWKRLWPTPPACPTPPS